MSVNTPISAKPAMKLAAQPARSFALFHQGAPLAKIRLTGNETSNISIEEIYDDELWDMIPKSQDNPDLITTIVNLLPSMSRIGKLMGLQGNEREEYWNGGITLSSGFALFPMSKGLKITDLFQAASAHIQIFRRSITHFPFYDSKNHIYRGPQSMPQGMAGEKQFDDTSKEQIKDKRVSGNEAKLFVTLGKDGSLKPTNRRIPHSAFAKYGELGGAEFAPVLEWFALNLSEAAGMPTTDFALVKQDNDLPPYLIVERFDMSPTKEHSKNHSRIMQDFLSLSGLNGHEKQNGRLLDDNFSYEDLTLHLIDICKKHEVSAADTRNLVEDYMKRTVLSWAVCDGDFHAKNASVFLDHNRKTGKVKVSLTPNYDIHLNGVEGEQNISMFYRMTSKHSKGRSTSFQQISDFITSDRINDALESLGADPIARTAEDASKLALSIIKPCTDKALSMMQNLPPEIKDYKYKESMMTDIQCGVHNLLQRAKKAGYDQTAAFELEKQPGKMRKRSGYVARKQAKGKDFHETMKRMFEISRSRGSGQYSSPNRRT